MVSMDGVIQAPGAPAEDPTRGFKFADGAVPHSFRLAGSRVSPNGVIVGHYEREGEIRMGDTSPDSPSEREIARRERMRREG